MKDCDLRHVILRIFPRTFQPITMKFNNHVTDGMMEKQRQCGRKRNHGPSLGLRLKILFNLFQKFYLNETWQFWSDCKRIETPNKNKPGKTKKMFIQYSFLADRTFSVFTTSSKCLPEVKKKTKKTQNFYFVSGSSSKRCICRRGEPPQQRRGSHHRWRRRSYPDPATRPASAGTPLPTTPGSSVRNLHTSHDQYPTNPYLRLVNWQAAITANQPLTLQYSTTATSGHDRIIVQPVNTRVSDRFVSECSEVES